MIRVAVADDQELVRAGFGMLIDAQPDLELVGEAADGLDAVELVRATRPDVVLMDVRMPRLDGIAATASIVSAVPSTKVLVLTTFDLDEYAFAALRAGASGFLIKDSPRDQLLASIRAVASGEAAVSSRVTRRMLDLFAPELPAGAEAGEQLLADLTPREREVLVAIGRGRTNPEIAAELFVSESTVKTHVGRILAKLALRDRVHAVIFCYEHRLVPRDEPPVSR